MCIELDVYNAVTSRKQYDVMRNAIEVSQYATRQLAEQLFNVDNDNSIEWIDYVSDNTGLDATHLRAIFFSGVPMTLQDYLILANYAGIDPISDQDANRTIIQRQG
ncbi:MAG: hypothetical protein IJ124_05330 [Clostridia bacterium]|nr:hypothetical protein [Clostridia bacterium]MBR1560375.1 hypothetical protein [Clostridia bacterium]